MSNRRAISGTEMRLLSRSAGVSVGCPQLEALSGSDIWVYFARQLQDEKRFPAMADLRPAVQDRHVFASRRMVAERVTFPLPLRRTGVMDRHARINRRKDKDYK